MSASREWAGEPCDVEEDEPAPTRIVPAPTAAPDVAPLDLDALQRVGWALVGAVLYLLGVVACGGGLIAVLGWWAGGALVLLAGGVPAGYSLVKAHQLRAAREQREHAAKFRGDHQGLVAGMLASAPVRTID